MGKPYVGILVSDRIFKGIPSRNTGFEKIAYYEAGGKRYGVKPCYFRVKDIKPGCPTIIAYVKEAAGYRLKTIPIPRVIHNRTTYKRSSASRMAFFARKGVKVFNGYYGKVGKKNTHQQLQKNSSIRKHLPTSAPGTVAALNRMMRRYPSLLIKPLRGSLGIGIRKVERIGSRWKLNMSKNRSMTFTGTIPIALKRLLNTNAYFIQQRVPLAKYNGKPFDIRVSVQRNRSGNWAVTGMVAKVAAAGHYVSNVHQGGKVYPLGTILRKYPGLNASTVRKRVESLSLAVARQLSKYQPNLADLGLDVGITRKGYPYFIENNRRELRYSFGEGGLIGIWRATYMNPMGYAKYLINK